VILLFNAMHIVCGNFKRRIMIATMLHKLCTWFGKTN